MALEMKAACEKCGRKLAGNDQAYICIYECTFCEECTESMAAICPNCGGGLVPRPKPGKKPPLL